MSEYKNWKNNCKVQTALYNAFNKYGHDSTEITFLFKSGGKIDQERLDKLEIQYINQYNTTAPNGYNIQFGGHGYSGYSAINEDFIKNHWAYWYEPVINIKTNKEYPNLIQWAKNEHCKKDSVYQLTEIDSDWIYKNEDQLILPYGQQKPITIGKNKLEIRLRKDIEAMKKELEELKAWKAAQEKKAALDRNKVLGPTQYRF